MFPIENLKQAVDTVKRVLTKEKVDKELTGQTSTSPFMSIKDGTERRVSFSNRDEVGDKIDKLTVMMGRLTAKDTHEKRPFKPQIYKSRGQHGFYGQGKYESRLGNRNRGQFMDNRPRQNYRSNNFRGNTRGYSRQNNRGNYRNERYNDYNTDRNRLRERTFTRSYSSNKRQKFK